MMDSEGTKLFKIKYLYISRVKMEIQKLDIILELLLGIAQYGNKD